MLSAFITLHVERAVQSLLVETGVSMEESRVPPVTIERPTLLTHGDYSSSIAMQLAKKLRMPPMHIAVSIKQRLEAQGCFEGLIQAIEVVPPGFLNMFMNWKQWALRSSSFDLPVDNRGRRWSSSTHPLILTNLPISGI